MSDVDERAGEKGILLALAACAGDPVFGGGDGERASGVDQEGTGRERDMLLPPMPSCSRFARNRDGTGGSRSSQKSVTLTQSHSLSPPASPASVSWN